MLPLTILITDQELASLSVLNTLRGYVAVHFRDCDLTPPQDLKRFAGRLHHCVVFGHDGRDARVA